MKEPAVYRRNFQLHLQDRVGYDGPVLLKEPAREQPLRSHLVQLHNEYAITRQLTDVAGVRPAYAKEGTESRPVLLLKFIQGKSLADLIRSASLDLAEKLRLAVNVARGLSHVHDHHVMHKDVSSANILVADGDAPGSQGGVYLIDFGLASPARQESPSPLAADDTLVGTLAYVSPEQTGRMNRQVDYRTDLYSLGVVLYELFTGRVPFDSGDVLEMIHNHIARQPRPPHDVDADVPRPVSDIIQMLLAKNAEDRYQTADGLVADLGSCLSQWREQGRLGPFELATDDFTGRLQIPQKLYGREAEVEQLRAILDRTVRGTAQLVLVAGYPGVGKTSLVREIHRDAIARQAVFVEGKFEQVQRSLPYSAWDQALTQLVHTWLGGSEATLARWRDTLLAAVGDQARVLIDTFPALERIIGPQPEVPLLGGLESQNRFNDAFNRFVSSVAKPEQPLVVFLDDLQWIDLASLSLIETLFALKSTSRLLVIGAYRSNEVNAAHPLEVSKDRMQAESDQVNVLTLEDLSPDDTDRLLADSLQLRVAECRDLSQILVEKTAGNPFYFRQLLYALESKELLRFDRRQRRWRWEEGLSHRLPAGGNVVELMTETIRALPAKTQHALSLGACMGSEFAVDALATLTGQPRTEVLAALSPALDGGLIIRSNERFSFVHDRIQETGYALIPEADRPRTHLEIGRALLEAKETKQLEEEVFAVVGHLNAGRALIERGSDKVELVTLNLRAGLKARSAAAFADAKRHVEIGLELLGPGSWQDHYELALSLHTEKAELGLITGHTDEVSASVQVIHAQARNTLDQVRAYIAQIEAEISRYEFAKALAIGLGVLEKLGVQIPAKPNSSDVQRLNQKLLDRLTSTPLDVVARLPAMTDETALATSSILAAISVSAYIVDPPLVPIVNYEGALLTAEFGHNTWSATFYARIALVAFSATRHEAPDDELRASLVLAKQMQAISHELLKKPETTPSRTKVLQILGFIAHWTEPIDTALEIAQATYESRVDTGDLLHSAYGSIHVANYGLAAGLSLDAYRRRVDDHVQHWNRLEQRGVAQWLSMFLQTAQHFAEPSPEPHRLIGTHFNEDDWRPGAEAAGDIPGRHWLSVLRLLLTYHFDVDRELDECVLRAGEFLAGGAGMVSYAIFHFYSALAKLRRAGQLGEGDRAETLPRVDDALRLMRFWSEAAPSTYQHKADLIAAERARVTGDLEGALIHYERAIDDARASGFTHEEALANELYARFWGERDNDRFAGPLMREAHSLYEKWDALAKAEHLARRYPQWLIGRSVGGDQPGTQIISDVIPGGLDLRTILKASQDIAGEIELDSLLARLMTDVIENTGAQRGFLILEKDGRWIIEARACVDEPELYSRETEDIAGSDKLAEGVVHYAARTQETVVLEDASRTGRFVDHQYVKEHRARSILCAPLVNQGKISAILYLENNLAPDVFSPQRVGLLKLLSSQMAISIDNARIHADLESLLESRSKALASAEAQVRTLFEHSPLGIGLTSKEGAFLSVNKAVLKMLRLTEEELLEHNVLDFYDDPSDRVALLRRLKESGFVQDFGVLLLRHDGTRFHASMSISPLVLEGNEVLLAMVQDVTAQIMAEHKTAVLEERARLGRELHDAVAQTILSASLLADATVRTAEEGKTISTGDLTKLRGMLRGAQDEMRTLLLEMRPTAVKDRTLGQLLASMAESARARSRAKVKLRIEGDRILPKDVTATLHRIAQESLNNAVRHAEATTITIDLVCDPDGVTLRITDNGQGFDPESTPVGHHGLSIMRERAQGIGANLEVQSHLGRGTELAVTWS